MLNDIMPSFPRKSSQNYGAPLTILDHILPPDTSEHCYVFVDVQFTRRSKQLLKPVIKTRLSLYRSDCYTIVQTVTL